MVTNVKRTRSYPGKRVWLLSQKCWQSRTRHIKVSPCWCRVLLPATTLPLTIKRNHHRFQRGRSWTAFFSNQRYNHSFIDFFGMEADTYDFIKKIRSVLPIILLTTNFWNWWRRNWRKVQRNNSSYFTPTVPTLTIANVTCRKMLFTPDYPMEAERKYRDNLVNAHDNSIRYTDDFSSRLIRMLENSR